MAKTYHDALSGKEGKAYVKIDSKNEELFCSKSVEAKIELSKSDIKCIGSRMTGSKITGMKGTGTMKIYFGYPLFSELVARYKDTGKPFYFDMVVTNDDPASSVGAQTVLLKDCLIDGVTLTKLDGESEDAIEDEIGFTFEDYEILEKFKSV